MKLSKKMEAKIKNEGLRKWKFWADIFVQEFNFPPDISNEKREIIAHNLALQVIWHDSHNLSI